MFGHNFMPEFQACIQNFPLNILTGIFYKLSTLKNRSYLPQYPPLATTTKNPYSVEKDSVTLFFL